MTQPTALSKKRPFGRSFGRVGAPLLCLAAIVGIFVDQSSEPQELAATSQSLLGPDYDTDGLADSMEVVLGTSPDIVDSDFDGYHDLEEVARNSDPLDAGSIPLACEVDLGMYTYIENGVLALHSAIYVNQGQLNSLSSLTFELGVVVNGTQIVVAEQTYGLSTLSFFYNATQDPNDTIVVLEMPVPEWIVDKLGQLSIYSIVRDTKPNGPQPVVDILNLVHSGGETMEIIPAPQAIALQKGGGIVYRPLSGDGSAPATSTSGQICWQDLVPAGTNGTTIQYEVERASCEDFDSYCSGADCSAKVGTTVDLPDPGKLLGG